MDQPDYSFAADLLSKFHASIPAIQALWLMAALGIIWILVQGAREIAVLRREPGQA